MLCYEHMSQPLRESSRLKKGGSAASGKIRAGNLTVEGVFNTFLRECVDARAWYYSVKPLPGKPYLGDILGLDSHNTFEFLACLGLFPKDKTNGTRALAIKKLESYPHEHMLTDYCLVTKFNRYDYYIRIGMKDHKDVPAPDDRAPVPHIPKLRSHQAQFLRQALQAVLIASASKADFFTPTKSKSRAIKSTTATAKEPTLILQNIRGKLLPLLLLPGVNGTNKLNNKADSKAVEAIMLDLADDIKHLRNKKLSRIFTTTEEQNPIVALVPTLHYYGVPYSVPTVLENCMREIYAIKTVQTDNTGVNNGREWDLTR
jgi:hypothetical protein